MSAQEDENLVEDVVKVKSENGVCETSLETPEDDKDQTKENAGNDPAKGNEDQPKETDSGGKDNETVGYTVEYFVDNPLDGNERSGKGGIWDRYVLLVHGLRSTDAGAVKEILKDELCSTENFRVRPRVGGEIGVHFLTEDNMKTAKEVLQYRVIKNRRLHVKEEVKPLKRKAEADFDVQKNQKRFKDRHQWLDFMDESPEKQLELKVEDLKSRLKSLDRQINDNLAQYSKLVDRRRKEHNGFICALDKFKEHPADGNVAYLCRFVREKEENGDYAVGIYIGSGIAKDFSLVKHNYPDHVLETAKVLSKMVATIEKPPDAGSDSQTVAPTGHKQFWKKFFIYSNRAKEMMMMIFLDPEANKEEVEKFTEELKEFFENGEGKECQVTSLHINMMSNLSSEHKLIMGSPYLEETILDMKILLPPTDQLWNTFHGAEMLCKGLEEVIKPTKDMTILELGSGTGLVATYMAKSAAEVYSFNNDEVADLGKKTAELNGVTNCTFVKGDPVDMILDIVAKVKTKEIYAILFPVSRTAGWIGAMIKRISQSEFGLVTSQRAEGAEKPPTTPGEVVQDDQLQKKRLSGAAKRRLRRDEAMARGEPVLPRRCRKTSAILEATVRQLRRIEKLKRLIVVGESGTLGNMLMMFSKPSKQRMGNPMFLSKVTPVDSMHSLRGYVVLMTLERVKAGDIVHVNQNVSNSRFTKQGGNQQRSMTQGRGMGRGMQGRGMGYGMQGQGMGYGRQGQGMGYGRQGQGMGFGMQDQGMDQGLFGNVFQNMIQQPDLAEAVQRAYIDVVGNLSNFSGNLDEYRLRELVAQQQRRIIMEEEERRLMLEEEERRIAMEEERRRFMMEEEHRMRELEERRMRLLEEEQRQMFEERRHRLQQERKKEMEERRRQLEEDRRRQREEEERKRILEAQEMSKRLFEEHRTSLDDDWKWKMNDTRSREMDGNSERWGSKQWGNRRNDPSLTDLIADHLKTAAMPEMPEDSALKLKRAIAEAIQKVGVLDKDTGSNMQSNTSFRNKQFASTSSFGTDNVQGKDFGGFNPNQDLFARYRAKNKTVGSFQNDNNRSQFTKDSTLPGKNQKKSGNLPSLLDLKVAPPPDITSPTASYDQPPATSRGFDQFGRRDRPLDTDRFESWRDNQDSRPLLSSRMEKDSDIFARRSMDWSVNNSKQDSFSGSQGIDRSSRNLPWGGNDSAQDSYQGFGNRMQNRENLRGNNEGFRRGYYM